MKLSPKVRAEIERLTKSWASGQDDRYAPELRSDLKAFARLAAQEAARGCVAICEKEAAEPSTLWEEPGCWTHATENCAAAIAAHFELEGKMPTATNDRWVSVSERLPVDGEIVDVFGEGERTCNITFRANQKWAWRQEDDEYWEPAPDVTHWMPLPKPPIAAHFEIKEE